MNSEYEKLARFYDHIHAELQEDVGFVLSFAARQAGRLLELGCGTGRLLIPLARAGYQVTGVDNSAAMLARATEHIQRESAPVQSRLTLLNADMNNLTGNEQFAGAIISYNTAMHLDQQQLGRLLRSLGQRLQPGSQLLLDLANPHLVEATPPDQAVTLERVWEDEASGAIVQQFASSWLDPDAQTLRITWWFDEVPGGSGPVQRTVSPMVYHYYYLHQLTGILLENGFTVVDILGNYQEEPFDEDSERLLLIAGN
ncbi:MAG: methyltransferase domain-containing protein [Anaerolineales bacterium]|nr:methyltransferase domain-containing protein [Anaerolineales bacterium]MCB0011773.1 methyltransferase domain-containing protein [Anaerolineales bacterium]